MAIRPPPDLLSTALAQAAEHNSAPQRNRGPLRDLIQAQHLNEVHPLSREHGRFAALDVPSVESELQIEPRTIQFHISGVSCSKCVSRIEALPTDPKLNMEWSRVDLSRDLLTVTRSPEGRFSKIAEKIESMGYKLEPVSRSTDWQKKRTDSNRRELIRLGIVAGLTGNIMLMAISIYGGASGELERLFHTIMFALSLPVATWGAHSIHSSAWLPLIREKRVSVDLPISLAILAGLVHGALSLFDLAQGSYLDSVAMLVLLIQGSRLGLRLARQKLDRQEDILPEWLIAPVEIAPGHWLPPRELTEGQTFRLPIGAMAPVDCHATQFLAEWDQSILSGESQPLTTHPHVRVPAGARLLSIQRPSRSSELSRDSYLELTVEAPQKEARIYRLVESWRQGNRERSSLSFLSDKAGQAFVLVVMSLAAVLAFLPQDLLPGHSLQPGWMRALTLLIVTCPCVFGFAIPLAESFALKRAAQAGLLVKNSGFFKKLLKVSSVVFDKTGTLTTGHYTVVKFEILDAPSRLSRNQLLALILRLEEDEAHPVARSLVSWVRSQPLLDAIRSERERIAERAVVSLPQGGRQLDLDGRHYQMVSVALNEASSQQFITTIELRENGVPLAQFQLEDEIRAGALALVQGFQNRKFEIRLATGDHLPQALQVAKKFGIAQSQVCARTRPEDKAKLIEIQREESRRNGLVAEPGVLMLGDGANDAEALTAADVGIAIKGDFDACLENADAVLTGTSLLAIEDSFNIAGKLKLALILCLGFATVFNAINGTLAVLGVMSPLVAAILMPISSLIVTGISYGTLSLTGDHANR